MLEAYRATGSVFKAADQTGWSANTCWHVGNRRGVRTSRRRYAVDEAYFEKIDTEEKAWILGFLTADGLKAVFDDVQKQLDAFKAGVEAVGRISGTVFGAADRGTAPGGRR